jgi:hypothetical protein
MAELHVGDRVLFDGRTCVVRGVSPMSAIPRRVQLEDVETGEWVEVDADDLRAREGSNPQPGDTG